MWAGPIDDADLVNLASCISWNMASNDSCEDHNTDSMRVGAVLHPVRTWNYL